MIMLRSHKKVYKYYLYMYLGSSKYDEEGYTPPKKKV